MILHIIVTTFYNYISTLSYPYAALAELLFGNNAKRIVTIFLDVTVFGACIPNLLIGNV